MDKSLDKATVAARIRSEADTIPDLLAWTKNQPARRLPATYNRKGNVWETLMAFRDEQIEKLPAVVNLKSIAYLLESDDKRQWMFYTIIYWILTQYNNHGMNEKDSKAKIFYLFRKVQEQKLATT